MNEIDIEKMEPCPPDIQKIVDDNFMDLLATTHSHTPIFDPYMSSWRVSQRLSYEFSKHRNLVIAFDFDNTIYDFHNSNFEFPEVIVLLRQATKLGLTMVCYTGNDDEELIRSYCAKHGIRIDYLNESPIKAVSKPHKPYFSILLDDRAGLASAVEALSIVLYKIEEGIL